MEISCDVSWFAERDIDVWLAEELRTNAEFGSWFLHEAGFTEHAVVPAYRTRVSVMDDAGRETDVEALFRASNGETKAVLVENKIKASFQPHQMEDYMDRGRRGKNDGKWAEFAVVLFAPSYRTPFAIPMPPEVVTLRFEDAAERLRSISANDPRLIYRAEFLERAAQPSTVVAAEGTNPFLIEWWKAVDEMIRREFADFFEIDRQRFPKTVYVNPRCANMPSYLRVDLKGAQGEVDLAFKNFPLDVLRKLVSSIKPDGIELVENKKSAALRIGQLAKFQISDGLAIIDERVKASYRAAHQLLSFWRSHRLIFDEANEKLLG
jgi:hypothetical protein